MTELIVYDAVVKSPWLRMRVAPKVFAHMAEAANICGRGFNRHVPKDARLADGMEDATLSSVGMVRTMLARRRTAAPASPAPAGPSSRELLMLLVRLLRAQLPWHARRPTSPCRPSPTSGWPPGPKAATWSTGTATPRRLEGRRAWPSIS